MLIKFLDGTKREIANLRGADLCGADLCGADLCGAYLCGADLCGADLCGAYLRGAYLRDANLRDANLRDANLRGANLANCKGLEQQCITPEGVLIGYKKLSNDTIATLHIPAKAKRLNAYGSRKCRAEYAIVVDGDGTDKHTGTVKYAKGKRVTPDKFDDDKRIGCSHGIHFFITRDEAEAY